MRKERSIKYYYVNKYIIHGFFCIVAGIMITLLLYNFVGFSDSYKIMSKEMLLAIKQYNIDLDNYVKSKFVIRMIELVILLILLKTKYNKLIKWIIVTFLTIKIGFVLTVFIIEMQFIGIINYCIIAFPHYLIYFYCLIKIFQIADDVKKLNHKKENKILVLKYYLSYFVVCILWIIAILFETYIKQILVKKIFIIPR